MKHEVKAGQTDYTALVYIPDPASTDGSGKTGLVAANLTVSFVRVETDNDVTVTDATGSLNDLSALTDAHADWGLKEVSSTLAPGLYRLDLADAVCATGAWSAVVYVMVTTSAAAASPMEFVLVPESPATGVNVSMVSNDATAADNLELMFDGTGYAGGTTKLGVDAVALSGDTVAADNAEKFFDGTGYAGTNNVIPTVTTVTNTVNADIDSVQGVAVTDITDFHADLSGLATVEEMVDGVWDEPTSGHATAGTTGKALTDAGAAGTPPTAGTIADAVWDEALSGHLTAGTAGKALSDSGAAGTPPTVAAIADGVWDELLSGHVIAGSAGEALADAQAGSQGAGAGAITWVYTLTSSVGGAPIADAHVWVTTDVGGTNVIASGTTDQNGVVTFQLDAGTVYVWRAKTGFVFVNPDVETVS